MDNPARQYLFQQLKQKRRKMTPAQRRKRPTRVRNLYPYAVERQYAQQIASWFRPLTEAVEKYFKEHGETMLRGDSMHTDATPGAGYHILISNLMGWVAQYFADPADKAGTAAIAMGIGRAADLTKWGADKTWGKFMMSLLGQEFTTSNAWWNTMQKTWVDNNYKLIRSVAERYIGQVNMLAESAIVNGYSYQTLIKDLMKLDSGLLDWQAKRLARDQIGKLNGLITKNQSQEAGFDMYEWSTAGDKRVRTEPLTHVALNDKLCSWNDATVFSIDKGKTWTTRPDTWEHMHPGMAIQCRCTGIPYMDDLLAEVDRALAEEAR